ncbi:MAG: DinB family protein, partial [Flavobacteriaceae bacterium]|nr:DinB family protein [Flavobacteriaceae bacterium]
MQFDYHKSFEILSRTPAILKSMLAGVSQDWYIHNEGADTWSPYDVLGHLIHGEKTDWIPRAEIILSDRADKSFIPFDRYAQMRVGQEKSLKILLKEFRELREANLIKLAALDLSETELEKTGMHPELGEVTLKELLATRLILSSLIESNNPKKSLYLIR